MNIKKHAPTTIEEYIYLDHEVKQQELSFKKRAKYAKLELNTSERWNNFKGELLFNNKQLYLLHTIIM